MITKQIIFSGLLLSGIFLAACQPKTTTPETDTTIMNESTPVMEDESVMIEGTDQTMPYDEVMGGTPTPSPTASPLMDMDTEMQMQTETEM